MSSSLLPAEKAMLTCDPRTICEILGVSGVRDAAMSIWSLVGLARFRARHDHEMRRWRYATVLSILAYGIENPSRKKRTVMDVDNLVQKWVPIIKGLSSGHTKDEIDKCEFESEVHLAPMLTAPVRQLREFFAKLCDALRADPSIPYFVWQTFDGWHEAVLKRAPDEDVKELKTELATKIADLVEKDVQPDIREAIIGALQWRSPETLEKVREQIETKGAKPRLRGRESCLFLVVGEGTAEEAQVML